MNTIKMANKIRNDMGLQDALDAIVIDTMNTKALELNSRGPEAQLKWLENEGEDIEKIYSSITYSASVVDDRKDLTSTE